jgi:hypothetical protein
MQKVQKHIFWPLSFYFYYIVKEIDFYIKNCKFFLPPHGISGRRIRQVAVTLYLGEESHQEGGARISECKAGEGHHPINSVHRPAIPLFTRLFSVGG